MSQVRLLSPLQSDTPAPTPGKPYDDETRDRVSDSTGTALGSPSRDGSGGTDRVRRDTDRVGRIRGIGTFYKQVVAELRKVIWPTRQELVTYTTVVVVFVLIITVIVALFDLAFGKAVLAVFGN
jgi:preprotein translocase subunit SecE